MPAKTLKSEETVKFLASAAMRCTVEENLRLKIFEKLKL
jgi:hypothetical protein